MLGKDHVKAIRAEYRGFGSSEWSKANKQDRYALQLIPEAYALVENDLSDDERDRLKPRGIAAEPRSARKKENRAKPNTYTVRLDDATNARLQAVMQRRGIYRNQDALEIVILEWLSMIERAEQQLEK